MTTEQRTTCPVCGNPDCIVREVFRQATRTEPMRSLGFQAFCPKCSVSFPVSAELVQLALA